MILIKPLILLILVFSPVSASGEFYKYKAENGHLVFTDDISRVPGNRQANIQAYIEYVSVKEKNQTVSAGQEQEGLQENRLFSLQLVSASDPETKDKPKAGDHSIMPAMDGPDRKRPAGSNAPGFKTGATGSNLNIKSAVTAQALISAIMALVFIYPLLRKKKRLTRYRGARYRSAPKGVS